MQTEATRQIAVFAQIIARLCEMTGGHWRYIQCPHCTGKVNYLEVTLPNGPTFLVALQQFDVISGGEVIQAELPPSAPIQDLFNWIQGISSAGNFLQGPVV